MAKRSSVRGSYVYSKSTKAIYCFPCMLFAKSCVMSQTLADSKKGFSDWRHLNPRIYEHESSNSHRENYLSWKTFEKHLKENKTIDDRLEEVIRNEKEKWRHILKIITDCVIFCGTNNLAFRGSSYQIGDPKCGIFLGLIELISHYDVTMAKHIAEFERTTYLSNKIQN